MCDVDDMDILYYLDVLAYRIQSKDNKDDKKEKDVYIDELGWL